MDYRSVSELSDRIGLSGLLSVMTAKREAVGCIAATDRRPSGKAPTRKWLRSRCRHPAAHDWADLQSLGSVQLRAATPVSRSTEAESDWC
jgi:hypothetical protein